MEQKMNWMSGMDWTVIELKFAHRDEDFTRLVCFSVKFDSSPTNELAQTVNSVCVDEYKQETHEMPIGGYTGGHTRYIATGNSLHTGRKEGRKVRPCVSAHRWVVQR